MSTASPTNKLYAAQALALSGAAHDTVVAIALDGADMSGLTESSNALVSEIATSGLSRSAAIVSVTMTSVANDTVTASKTFLVNSNATVYGAGVFTTASSGGNMLFWGSFTSAQPVEIGDTLAVTFSNQSLRGS